jgi:hypothetical protein
MTTGWNAAKELAEKHKNEGGIFVRLANNGDKVIGAFCGEPFAREVVWLGEKYENYDPKNSAHQAAGKKPSLRVAINFFVPADGSMKVIEVGTQTFRDVVKCREKFPFGAWLFEIERHGESGSAKTKYSVLPDSQIDAGLRARVAAAKEHDLAAVIAGGDDDDEPGPRTRVVDGPIDAATAADLVARMKALPRAELETMLGQLGVTRVRDLKASGVERAKALLATFEAGVPGEPAEIDPFA